LLGGLTCTDLDLVLRVDCCVCFSVKPALETQRQTGKSLTLALLLLATNSNLISVYGMWLAETAALFYLVPGRRFYSLLWGQSRTPQEGDGKPKDLVRSSLVEGRSSQTCVRLSPNRPTSTKSKQAKKRQGKQAQAQTTSHQPKRI
jgi:hypothetical protein